MPFNVLITSLSRKVPMVREVRKALRKIDPGGKVFGADCDNGCNGKYFVDHFWLMPPLKDLHAEDIVGFCQKNDIKAIIPSRDGELVFFSEIKEVMETQGIFIMISPKESVLHCVDKLGFYLLLKDHNGIHPIDTAIIPEVSLGDRWVVKERFGSGSVRIMLDIPIERALAVSKGFEEPVFQPFIDGSEFSIDVYIPRSGSPKGAVVRCRDRVQNGESQVTTTIKKENMAAICLKAADILGINGHGVFQAIEDSQGKIHLIECNGRFGGASTLSVAAGLDSFYWFLLESRGDDLNKIQFNEAKEGLRQIRFAEDMLIR